MLPLVLAVVLPLLPDQVPPPSSSAAAPATVSAPRTFSRLFTVGQAPSGDGEPRVVITGPKGRIDRKIVCGTTILIVDGRIDPKMAIAPKGKDVDPRMPRMPKPMCGEEK